MLKKNFIIENSRKYEIKIKSENLRIFRLLKIQSLYNNKM